MEFGVQGVFHSESALDIRAYLLAYELRLLVVREVDLLGCEKSIGFS